MTTLTIIAMAKGLKIFLAILIILFVSLLITGIVAFLMLRSNAKKRRKIRTANQYSEVNDYE